MTIFRSLVILIYEIAGISHIEDQPGNVGSLRGPISNDLNRKTFSRVN